jgi:flap endonuclease-1
VESGDKVAARKWGQQSVIATTKLIQDAKRLLTLMGIPWVQAPGEGEAQAAYMATKGSVWASASQDYDSVLFGAPRLIRNLSITGRRKLPKKNVYIKVEPEIIDLKNLLQNLEITWEQVIDVGILVGTDYNPGGVKGVGPKTALKLIKKHGELKSALPELKNPEFPHDIDDIREMFLKPIITDDFKLGWRKPDTAGILTYLCGEHNFNRDKVLMAVSRMEKGFASVRSTSTLDRFFNS